MASSRFLLLVGLLLSSCALPAVLGRGSRKIHLRKPDPKPVPDPKHDHITFDPMVAEVERHLEDRAWESQFEKAHHHRHHVEAGHHHEHARVEDLTVDEYHDEDAEHEEFLHDAGVDDPESLDEEDLDHVDMEERLEVLFPLIDEAPPDGKINVKELAAWELRQYEDAQEHRMARELEGLDGDGDGRVSLKEYMHADSDEEVKHWSQYPEHDQEYYRQEQERFEVADEDGDGFLDRHQLYNILHPEESASPRMRVHLRLEEVRNYDTNKNGKLELAEWEDGMWHIIHDWEEEERKWAARLSGKAPRADSTAEEKRSVSQDRFKALDRDADEGLSPDELEPVMFILQPGERHYSQQTARHLMEQADEDHDNQLTLREMKKHKEIFYELDQGHQLARADT